MEREGRASAAPEPWIAHSRAAPNSGTSWQSCPGSIRKPAPPRAGSSLRRRQTVEPLRKSPPRTFPAIPLRIRLRKGSTSKVAGFYSATRDRVMPPLRGLLLLRRVHLHILTSTLTRQEDVAVTVADAAFGKKGCSSLGFRYGGRSRPIYDTNSRLRPGDADMETSPATGGAFYPDAPIVGLDDALADRQPQSRASPRRMIAPPKTVEDVRQVLGRDPWAGVPNDNLSMALALACAKRYATALGRELESVSE